MVIDNIIYSAEPDYDDRTMHKIQVSDVRSNPFSEVMARNMTDRELLRHSDCSTNVIRELLERLHKQRSTQATVSLFL